MSARGDGYTLRPARGDDFEAVSDLLAALGRDPGREETLVSRRS